ncbi:MAG: hypothetical protein WAN11_27700 [Syntrophobacteraceae bacterium]
MPELLFFLIGLATIILGSWLFIFFPPGGLVVIFLGLICLGRAGKILKKQQRGPTSKRNKQDVEPIENDSLRKSPNWGCLIPVLFAIVLFIALAIYNNRH